MTPTPSPAPHIAPPPIPLRRRPIFTPYVFGWILAGTLSAGYFAILATAPELLDDLSPGSVYMTEPQDNQGQRAAARLASDVRAIRESVAQVQFELSKVKTDVLTHGERERALTAQLAALESKLEMAQSARTIETATPQRQPQPPANPAAPAELETMPQAIDTVAPPAATEAAPKQEASGSPQQPKLINADTATTIRALETGSVTTTARSAAKTTSGVISFGPAIVKPAAKPIGVQISSGASIDSLRLSWSVLADRHGDALKNLQARYVESGNSEAPNFDLIAGPIKSKTEAARVCKALAAKNIPCKVGDFAGDAL